MSIERYSCRHQSGGSWECAPQGLFGAACRVEKNVVHLPCTPEEQLDTLTTKGREQAAALGNFLRDKDIVAIQSSPAGRTRETAQAMSEILGLPEGFEVEEAFSSLRGGKGGSFGIYGSSLTA